MMSHLFNASLRRAGSNITSCSRRYLYLHEYQSKSIMSSYGVNVQQGDVASTVQESAEIARKLVEENCKELIVKAQVLAGGRGKGRFDNGFQGGVKLCFTPDEVAAKAKNMLGARLITEQTGPEGQPCNKVLVLKGINFDRELYFALLLDRSYDGPVAVVSKMGGMDIEKVAKEHPDEIHTIPIDGAKGLTPEITDQIAELLGFTSADSIKRLETQIQGLYNLFMEKDATQIEINPLVETTENEIYCVDAKINFDDNASFRHKEIFGQRDFSMEDAREVEAAKHDLNYIGLDGNIGCMVNGAGLAMATMDIIKLHGGAPANFLDVGGNADVEQVAAAFEILNNDPEVKAILINIFGGIMKCDIIAEGIVAANEMVHLDIPLIVRLEGTNVDAGKAILQNSGMNIVTANDLDDAAIKAVRSIGQSNSNSIGA
uniref:Succinate--CoA ligase [ADP-forming] subunit beta, mitochondrial n=1 Tax=Spongospora subterranea TaxID=70186 RepID=A0A0H5R5D8_9EUKA|eukprot:CRZ09348.1 hypothetical protein [Spongospora subterranea]